MRRQIIGPDHFPSKSSFNYHISYETYREDINEYWHWWHRTI